MKFTILTAFPGAFSYLKESIPNRAVKKGLAEINIVDLRDFTEDNHKTIDDKPFGGGQGMLLMVEPIYKALKCLGVFPVKEQYSKSKRTKVILTSAKGSSWSQSKAQEYSQNIKHVVIICGHYEGVDQRVVEHLIDEEVSIGNYILSGGELASMVIVDSIVRLIDGVVGKTESVKDETSFEDDKKLLEYPQYTRPEVFATNEGEQWGVPDILLSGHHKNIGEWKEKQKKVVNNGE